MRVMLRDISDPVVDKLVQQVPLQRLLEALQQWLFLNTATDRRSFQSNQRLHDLHNVSDCSTLAMNSNPQQPVPASYTLI